MFGIDLKPVDLKKSVNRLEDGIITLSGPALAISGIIAGIDLVTGGNMLRDWPGLTLAWAICLLLTLDFQVLNLGVRAQRLYVSKQGRRKYAEIGVVLAIASGIAYVSIQMQSIIAIANSASIPVAEAANRLGINLLALTWERSILVLALIFLSGWSRETKDGSSETPVEQVKQTGISDEVVQTILGKLATLEALEQRLTQPQITVSESSETPPALLETGETESETAGKEANVELEMIEEEMVELALDAQLAALIAINQNVTSRDAALIVGRPHTTVYRALNRMKQTGVSSETEVKQMKQR